MPMPDEMFVVAGGSCAVTPKVMLKSPESMRNVFMGRRSALLAVMFRLPISLLPCLSSARKTSRRI
jgi:hypothetical protein